MIIIFHSEIFKTEDSEVNFALAKILRLLPEKDHFIDSQSISQIFFDEFNNYCFQSLDRYLSPFDKDNLKNYIQKVNTRPLTRLHKNHLTHLKIGIVLGYTHPKDAFRIINERSLIILENNPNDWKFVRGIVCKYSNFGKRKNLYFLLERAINKSEITYDHAGGFGSIQKQIQSHLDGIYSSIYKYKLCTIFDSDKKCPDFFNEKNVETQKQKKNLIKYLKRGDNSTPISQNDLDYCETDDLIVWHILYKAKLESYLPIQALIEYIDSNTRPLTEDQRIYLLNLSEEDIDFSNYYLHEFNSVNLNIRDSKDVFPELFLRGRFSVDDLEARCSHHKVSFGEEYISEIEQILLKIVRII